MGKKIKAEMKPIHSFSREEIQELRWKLDLTQKLFSKLLGVSVKTVESWEAGINTPNGSASRLMELISRKPSLLFHFIEKAEK